MKDTVQLLELALDYAALGREYWLYVPFFVTLAVF